MLARHLGAPLLINEIRATSYAAALGITVFTVPAVVVWLRRRDVISDRAARRKLELIMKNAAQDMIDDATLNLDRLQSNGTSDDDSR